jgi:hypothetical protein
MAQFNEGGAVGPTIPRDEQINDPFRDGDIPENLENIAARTASASKPHPLGLLPDPVIRTDETRYTYEDFIWRRIDTSLLRFHEYNPVSKWKYPHHNLGNIGQNYHSLVFDPQTGPGFHHGITGFSKYWAVPERVRYFNTKVPYTSLFYNLGAETENNARVVHSQNVGPFYNAAFDYRLLNRHGAFRRQKTLMHNLSFNNWFNSKGHRYALMFAFLFNKMETFENGGTDLDGLYEKFNSGVRREQVPINLDDAKNAASNKGIYLRQFFFLGDKRNVQTSDTTEMEIVQRKSAISYTFHYDNWKYRYTDDESDSSFYTGFYYDSTMTNDSTRFWTVRHSLRWENTPERWTEEGRVVSKFRYFVSLNYDYTKYTNADLLRNWNNVSVSGGLNSNPLNDRKWHYGVTATAHFGPEAAGDFNVTAFTRWKINDLMHLTADLSSIRQTPSQRIREYRSNHFLYTNDFDPVFHNRAALIFRCDHGDIDAELTWHNVQRYIYLDEDQDYRQAASNLNVLVFRASKAFDWKHFYLYNGITAQYVSREDQVQVPKFILKQSFHYQGGFFSGNVNAHLGFDITYNTNYYADGYQPALMEFYRQDSEKLKFYPVIDLFFEIMIKRAQLFFLFQHINQGMFQQKGYFVAPDYGAQDRVFKVGVSWKFYD